MPYETYTMDQLIRDKRLCCRLKGCKWILVYKDGDLTEGYMVDFLPDVGHLILRDSRTTDSSRTVISLHRFSRILIDAADRIHES